MERKKGAPRVYLVQYRDNTMKEGDWATLGHVYENNLSLARKELEKINKKRGNKEFQYRVRLQESKEVLETLDEKITKGVEAFRKRLKSA